MAIVEFQFVLKVTLWKAQSANRAGLTRRGYGSILASRTQIVDLEIPKLLAGYQLHQSGPRGRRFPLKPAPLQHLASSLWCAWSWRTRPRVLSWHPISCTPSRWFAIGFQKPVSPPPPLFDWSPFYLDSFGLSSPTLRGAGLPRFHSLIIYSVWFTAWQARLFLGFVIFLSKAKRTLFHTGGKLLIILAQSSYNIPWKGFWFLSSTTS